MARHVVNDITSSLQTAPFFSLMVIETTDITNKERVVFVRFLDGWISFLTAHEKFLGLYCVGSTEASVIFSVTKDYDDKNESMFQED